MIANHTYLIPLFFSIIVIESILDTGFVDLNSKVQGTSILLLPHLKDLENLTAKCTWFSHGGIVASSSIDLKLHSIKYS